MIFPLEFVNFRAFEMKFNNICRYLFSSPCIFIKKPTFDSSKTYSSLILFY